MPNPATVETDGELLSTSGAARIMRVSEGTVRNLANRGDLPTRRTAGTGIRLFRRQDVEEMAASRAEGAA